MQRRAQIGLNKGESHHALKNALRIGRQGEIRGRTTEGQHYRMAGLNLLAVIYWNTARPGEDTPACPSSPNSCHTPRPSDGATSYSPANTDGQKDVDFSLACHFALFRNRPHSVRFDQLIPVIPVISEPLEDLPCSIRSRFNGDGTAPSRTSAPWPLESKFQPSLRGGGSGRSSPASTMRRRSATRSGNRSTT